MRSYASYKSMLTDFMSYVNYFTPMIFAALAVAVALRAGLFNIGVSGHPNAMIRDCTDLPQASLWATAV